MSNNKSWLVVIAGHILERYEVTLYGYYAATLAPIFFPNNNSQLALFFSLATFAAGYIARPLGGIIFGHFGDTLGRKKALLGSILCVTVPTFMIGLLPTYGKIGVLAPLLLTCCRLLQGACVGGEYSGAAVFFFEHAAPNSRGLAGSIMSATAFSGAVLGTLIGSLTAIFFSSELAWRLPFILGGILGIVIYFLRKNMIETPLFEKIKKNKAFEKYPLLVLFKTCKIRILCAFLLGAQGHIILYMITIYMNTILIKSMNLESYQIMLLNTSILVLWIVLMPIFGKISDKVNKNYFIFILSVSICCISYPLFLILNNYFSLKNIIAIEIVFSILGAGLFGVTPGFLPQLFKTQSRYSGVAIGQTLGQALLGGTSPLIATFLSSYVGMMNALVIMLSLSGMFGLVSSIFTLNILKISFEPQKLVLPLNTSS